MVIDHYIGGDGSAGGSRTARTPLPAAMAAVNPASIGITDRDQMVEENAGLVDCPLSAHGDADADRNIGQVPQSGRVHLVVVAPPVNQLAAEQRTNDLDRLAQHVLPLGDRRPALADHVLVEVFAAAQTQGEPAVGENLNGRCLLRDDRRVIAHGRTGHVGIEIDAVGSLRYRAQHRPRVGGVAL